MLPSQLETSNRGDGLAPGYILLSPEQAADFGKESLTKLDESGISRNLLNILGLRLRADTTAHLTFQTPEPVFKYSGGYIDYLTEVFHIPGKRVKAVSAPKLQQGLAILAEPVSVLDPVVTQWIERSYALGDIGLEHHVDPKITDWQITITQHGYRLAQFDKASTAVTPSMMLHGISTSNASEIVASIGAKDSNGNIITSTDTLHLSAKSAEFEPDTIPTITRFVLLPDSSQSKMIERLIDKAKEIRKPYQIQMNRSGTLANIGELNRLERMISDCLPPMDNGPNIRPFHSDRNDLLGPRIVITILK